MERREQMKILGICGSHNKKKGDSPSEWILQVALDAAKELGAETRSIRLIDYTINNCSSCHLCFCDYECPLFDSKNDQAKEVFDMIDKADGLIFSSPVYSYHQPAILMQLIQRARFFHEVERGRYMGLKSIRSNSNPFSGKPIGTLVSSATIGNETALADLMHNFRGLGAAPVACAGICLLDSVIGKMYKNSKNEKLKKMFQEHMTDYKDNECAAEMARGVGKWVYKSYHSEVFQKIKHYIKL
jgi:multimeric flavodoxin WrbA